MERKASVLWDLAEDRQRPTQRQRQWPPSASETDDDSPSQVAFVASSPDDNLDDRSGGPCRESFTTSIADAAVPGSRVALENRRTAVENRHGASSRSADMAVGGNVCVTCGRGCACRPVQPPATYPPLTTWTSLSIHNCLPASELDAAKALQWSITHIDAIISTPTRYKIGMTGDVAVRWESGYRGLYDAMHVLHATRSKDCAFMLEASLIELYSHFNRQGTVLVNRENNDKGGTGRPRDDVPWYYVYVVSFCADGCLHPQFARNRR